MPAVSRGATGVCAYTGRMHSARQNRRNKFRVISAAPGAASATFYHPAIGNRLSSARGDAHSRDAFPAGLGVMTISAISSSSASSISTFQQDRQAFNQLTNALQSGDLTAAQNAYNTLASSPMAQGNSPFAQAIQQIGQDLQSGDASQLSPMRKRCCHRCSRRAAIITIITAAAVGVVGYVEAQVAPTPAILTAIARTPLRRLPRRIQTTRSTSKHDKRELSAAPYAPLITA